MNPAAGGGPGGAAPDRAAAGDRPGVGGVPAEVAAAVLALPAPRCAYVYRRAALAAAVARVRAVLPPRVRLLYAVKANSDRRVVAALAALVDGLEVASAGELALAREVGAGRIAFGGPAKTDAALAAAAAAGARVHVEGLHELRRLAALTAGRAGPGLPVALRVNRAAAAPAGSHRMAGAATPFGFDEADVGAALAVAAAAPGLAVDGLHVHAVSNNLDAAAHAGYVTATAAWAGALAGAHGLRLEYLNVGGGLGVDYAGGARFDLAVFGAGLAAAAASLPAGAELVVEPGRYLAAGAGWYAAEVLDVKRTHGRWFAVLRGGTHHFRLPAAWGYSHPFAVLPVAHWPYPWPRPQVRDAAVTVAGELCTPRDVLARDVPVARVRVGDVLVFGDAGAYGWDISHHDFLRHRHPDTVVL
ncbi:diaminopimelate decarboxylase [Pilimelia terevasa]|uniref:Diaminopimelate decarboxylase n=1 Tax=Pilimelia terevasa TaxID=53372 RepID=A0A8J3FLS0_9ACTN|nr:alanine racemase [Pilimelia terevasa]GGK37318.1 diaminopimelate decarboxylase [Pilimelia terevasa]